MVFGSVPFERSWLTEHHLAHQLAARRRVLFVDPLTSPLSGLRRVDGPRTPQEFLRAARLRRVGRLHVLQPYALPPVTDPRALRASRPLLHLQIGAAARRVGIRRPLAVVAFGGPELLGLAEERAMVLLVKDLNDAEPDLLGVSAERIRSAAAALAAEARCVITISDALQETLAARGIPSVVLPHGYDTDAPEPAAHPPPDVADLRRPRFGYVGRIDARLDFTLLDRIAAAHPEGTLVMVGPVSPRLDGEGVATLRARPNVVWLGVRPRTEVPSLLAHLDCALLPYLPGAWADHGSPLKLWDYLGAGPPIVGTGYTVLRRYPPPLVRFADNHDEALGAVSDALASPGAEADVRRAMARANGWDERAREFERIVDLPALDRETPG